MPQTKIQQRELKEKNPEKYEQMRERARQRDNARNAHKRALKERGELTADEIENATRLKNK